MRKNRALPASLQKFEPHQPLAALNHQRQGGETSNLRCLTCAQYLSNICECSV